MKKIVFGSPDAQAIAEFDRAVRVLDAKLRAGMDAHLAYVISYDVQACISRLAGYEDDTDIDLYQHAWEHMLKSGRWILFQRGRSRIDDMFQPVDEGEDGDHERAD